MTTIYAPADVLVARMMRRVTKQADGCWIFTGAVTSAGYGCVGAGVSGKTVLTHRLVVIARDGSIPEGMTIDHTCHDSATCRLGTKCPHRRCVNPDHLAVVTGAANTGRQWESNRCREGHELRVKPSRGDRYCGECENERRRKRSGRTSSVYWAAKRGEVTILPTDPGEVTPLDSPAASPTRAATG